MAVIDRLLKPLGLQRIAPAPPVAVKRNPAWPIIIEDLLMSRGTEQDVRPEDQDLSAFLDTIGLFSWVEACTRAIVNACVSVPWYVMGPDGDPIDDHPLIQKLDNPNPEDSGWSLRVKTDQHLLYTGNAYWALDGSITELGEGPGTLEIWPLRPDKVTIIPSQSDAFPVAGYVYTNSLGRRRTLAPEQVIHFKVPNPRDPLYGLSPIRKMERTLRLLDAAIAWNEDFFRNGASLSGVIKGNEIAALSDLEIQRLRERFESEHQARGKRRRVLFLGNAEWQETGVTPKDADFLALLAHLRNEIHAVYGVPPVQTGLMEFASYATAHQQDAQFFRGTVIPQNELKSEHLNAQPLVLLQGVKLNFDYGGVEALQEDKVAQAQIDQGDVDRGIRTINEVREARGLGEPVEWGDVPPWELTADPLGTDGEDTDTEPPDDEEPPEESEDEDEAVEAAGPLPDSYKADLKTKASRTRLLRDTNRRMTPLRRLWKKRAAKAARRAGKEAVRIARRRGDVKALSGNILAAPLEKALRKELLAPARASYRLGVRDATEAVDRARQKQGYVDPTMPEVYQFILAWVLDMAKALTDTQATRLQKLVQIAWEQGQTVREFSEVLKTHFEGMEDAWAERVARTELNGLYNAGTLDVFAEAEVEKKRWISARDDRVRDDHAAMDGKVAAVSEDFVLPDGSSGPYPGAINEVGQNCNCRCLMVAVLE